MKMRYSLIVKRTLSLWPEYSICSRMYAIIDYTLDRTTSNFRSFKLIQKGQKDLTTANIENILSNHTCEFINCIVVVYIIFNPINTCEEILYKKIMIFFLSVCILFIVSRMREMPGQMSHDQVWLDIRRKSVIGPQKCCYGQS